MSGRSTAAALLLLLFAPLSNGFHTHGPFRLFSGSTLSPKYADIALDSHPGRSARIVGTARHGRMGALPGEDEVVGDAGMQRRRTMLRYAFSAPDAWRHTVGHGGNLMFLHYAGAQWLRGLSLQGGRRRSQI